MECFRLFLLSLALLAGPLSAPAQNNAEIYEYDSTLSWVSQMEKIIDEVVGQVVRFLKPVQGRISSHFGMRKHPILGVERHHEGIDIACAVGSEVRAVLPGTVDRAGKAGGYGNLVSIHHEGDISESRYGHLSQISVKPGDKVSKGQLIGFSGMSGLATGPHLHFELYRGGHPVDPERLLEPLRQPSADGTSRFPTLGAIQ